MNNFKYEQRRIKAMVNSFENVVGYRGMVICYSIPLHPNDYTRRNRLFNLASYRD